MGDSFTDVVPGDVTNNTQSVDVTMASGDVQVEYGSADGVAKVEGQIQGYENAAVDDNNDAAADKAREATDTGTKLSADKAAFALDSAKAKDALTDAATLQNVLPQLQSDQANTAAAALAATNSAAAAAAAPTPVAATPAPVTTSTTPGTVIAPTTTTETTTTAPTGGVGLTGSTDPTTTTTTTSGGTGLTGGTDSTSSGGTGLTGSSDPTSTTGTGDGGVGHHGLGVSGTAESTSSGGVGLTGSTDSTTTTSGGVGLTGASTEATTSGSSTATVGDGGVGHLDLGLSGASTTPAYTVVPGDTMTGIAAKYGISLADLESVNKSANFNLIFPGQKINIPGGATVTSNDTTAGGATSTTDTTVGGATGTAASDDPTKLAFEAKKSLSTALSKHSTNIHGAA